MEPEIPACFSLSEPKEYLELKVIEIGMKILGREI